MLKIITILVVVASVLALFYPLPLSKFQLRPQELGLVIIQGNSILSNNEPFTEQPVSYADILGKDPECPVELQCKYYAKSRIPTLPLGNANTIPTNSPYPVVGGAVLFYSNPYGHIAYVEKVFGDMIFISEQNQKCCGCISSRWISIKDSRIKGFYVP